MIQSKWDCVDAKSLADPQKLKSNCWTVDVLTLLETEPEKENECIQFWKQVLFSKKALIVGKFTADRGGWTE